MLSEASNLEGLASPYTCLFVTPGISLTQNSSSPCPGSRWWGHQAGSMTVLAALEGTTPSVPFGTKWEQPQQLIEHGHLWCLLTVDIG